LVNAVNAASEPAVVANPVAAPVEEQKEVANVPDVQIPHD